MHKKAYKIIKARIKKPHLKSNFNHLILCYFFVLILSIILTNQNYISDDFYSVFY